jgi:hypothetical protein
MYFPVVRDRLVAERESRSTLPRIRGQLRIPLKAIGYSGRKPITVVFRKRCSFFIAPQRRNYLERELEEVTEYEQCAVTH